MIAQFQAPVAMIYSQDSALRLAVMCHAFKTLVLKSFPPVISAPVQQETQATLEMTDLSPSH